MQHEGNQSPVFAGYNAFTCDPLLQQVTGSMKEKTREGFVRLGKWAGSSDTLNLARLANENTPVLHTHDARGERSDTVEFHPAWHALMRKGTMNGLHNSLWVENPEEAGNRNLARAVRVYLTGGVEQGHLCPLIMTSASVAALRSNLPVFNEWLPKIQSGKYDPSNRPAQAKTGALIGMGMTEREGGSDVRLNRSVAEPLGNDIWQVTGQKWFMSAPMCDAFLVLAQMQQGLGCFLLPRILDEGKPNGLQFQRLKNKLGNRSNASSEVEFHESLGFLIGEPGRGIQTIMEMVNFTRLDCAVASAGLMRVCLAEAVHHCRNRSAFGAKLIDQPLMERVLADIALDVVAAGALAMRLASAFDRAGANPVEAAYVRLMTPVVKYWVCKNAPSVIYETLECLGGNGYVETGNLARHYREAPLNAIWEGAGNVMCLDVLRVLGKSGEVVDAVLEELQNDLGSTSSAKLIDVLRSAARMVEEEPGGARIFVEQLAYTAAAAELRRTGARATADAFLETRLGGLWRSTYGMLDSRIDARALLNREFPVSVG